jgi:hypothetical protein
MARISAKRYGWLEMTNYLVAAAMTCFMAGLEMTPFMAVRVQISLFSKNLMEAISATRSWILKLALTKLECKPIELKTDGYH